jgi:hypothetical protein
MYLKFISEFIGLLLFVRVFVRSERFFGLFCFILVILSAADYSAIAEYSHDDFPLENNNNNPSTAQLLQQVATKFQVS